MEINLQGRNALITGGSMGLGRAMARRFAASGAGVAMVARRQVELDAARIAIENETGARIVAISADVSSADGCTEAFQKASQALGQIDILVNNAGSSQRGEFESITDEMWQADLDLKLFGAIRLSRLVLPGMRERRWGRVINVLNTGAKAPPPTGAPTSVSRAAGLALMKILAGEYAPHNVLVNAMLIGKIRSDQWERRHAQQDNGQSLEEYYTEMGKPLPLGRLGTAEEFANMACFLVSEEGSYISGAAINVDGAMCPVG